MNLQLSLCKPKRDKSAIRIRFTLPQTEGRHEVMTGVKDVVCNTWNSRSGQVSLNKNILRTNGMTVLQAELINSRLHHAQTTLVGLINEHYERCFPKAIDVQALKAEYNAMVRGQTIEKTSGRLDVVTSFDEYVKRPGIRPYHQANLLRTQRKVIEFLNVSNSSRDVSKINETWLIGFASFWMDEKRKNPQCANTVQAHLKRIRCVLRALNDDYTLARSLNRRIKLIQPTPVVKPTLDVSEIELLSMTEFPSATLNRTRDWFVIQCWTGIRRSDLMELTMNDITKHDGKWRIRLFQNKTHGLIDIPLHPQAASIIDRLGGLPRPMNPAHYGREIKNICRIAGFDEMMIGDVSAPLKQRGMYPRWKLIASHTARRSAATNLIRAGVSMDVACLLTGHTNVEQLSAYIQMTTSERSKQLDAAIALMT